MSAQEYRRIGYADLAAQCWNDHYGENTLIHGVGLVIGSGQTVFMGSNNQVLHHQIHVRIDDFGGVHLASVPVFQRQTPDHDRFFAPWGTWHWFQIAFTIGQPYDPRTGATGLTEFYRIDAENVADLLTDTRVVRRWREEAPRP